MVPKLKVYVILDLIFYVLYYISSITMIYTINIDNFVKHKRLQAVISLPAYVVGNWGFYLLFDPKLNQWFEEHR